MFLLNKKISTSNTQKNPRKKHIFTLTFRHLSLLITTLTLSLLTIGCSSNLYEPTSENTNSLTNSIEDSSSTDKSLEDNEPALEENVTLDEKEIIDQGKEALNQEKLLKADSINTLIESMTLEQKIAQLFIVDFYNMTNEYQIKTYNSDIHSFLKQYPVGGLIYFAENIESRSQVIELNQSFQKDLAIPLFISIDEEGGLVSRLGKADIGVSHLADASDLSLLSEDDLHDKAKALGFQIKELGFNMDFAPVLDVNTNPDNPVIGTRSFSSDPSIVATYGTVFSMGLNEAGIISTGKHFPGHGDTTTDSHLGLTSISQDIDQLRTTEFVPFIEAIQNNIPAIMMGHINTPNIKESDLPASLSPYMITSILRDELGFKGLVLTDSLRMKAITDFYQPKDVGLMLLKAGGDIILIPDNFIETYIGILDAVQSGELSEERINESVKRILQAKADYDILKF